MINFNFIRAASQQHALQGMVSNKEARFIAGGTNLIDLMKHNIASPPDVIDINALPLKQITTEGNKLVIGAMVTNSELAAERTVVANYPLLSLALNAGASPQIRNMASVGGNIMQRTRCTYFYDTAMPCNKRSPGTGCGALKGYNRMHAIFGASEQCIAVHPSDMCVALAALDAMVVVQGPKKERKIPFSDFHRLPGNEPQKDNTLFNNELITSIELTKNQFNKHVHYLKVRDRSSYAFAVVSVAAALQLNKNLITDARIALGGVAHKPWRMHEAEAFLKGKVPSAAIFEQASKMGMDSAKGYGHNNFKLQLVPKAVAEALAMASKA